MKKPSILLVDDEESILSALRRSLRRENYNIFTAGGGEEAVDIIKFNDIAVVVTDERMPHMDGVEVLDNVREWSPDTFRIMLTGYADLNAAIGSINRGEVHKFITKPWEDDQLLAIIREGVERYNLIEENRRLTVMSSKQRDELQALNATLEIRIKERTRELEESQVAMRKSYFETIQALAVAVDERDAYTHNHSKRVTELSVRIAHDLGLTAQERENIRIAGLLHDIGKIGIRDAILLKPSVLTEEEYDEIKTHPLRGAKILESIKELKDVIPYIKHHHERFDGKGYHGGLRGLDIPVGARVIAVCDAYDAITSNRAYRKLRGHEDAVKILKENSGSQFDPTIVDSLLRVLEEGKDS